MADTDPRIIDPLPPVVVPTSGTEGTTAVTDILVQRRIPRQKIGAKVDQDPDVAYVKIDPDTANPTVKVSVIVNKQPPNREILLSIWDNGEQDPDHQTALYRATEVVFSWSFDRTVVPPYKNFFDENDKRSVIKVTATVNDDLGQPLKNFPLEWTGNPAAPTKMRDENGDDLPLNISTGRYMSSTGDDGRSIILVSNYAPTVIAFQVFCRGYNTTPKNLFFTNLGVFTPEEPLGAPSLPQADPDTRILNLDDIQGDKVQVDLQKYNLYEEGISQGAIWLNGRIVAYQTIPPTFRMEIKKSDFISDGEDNTLGYMGVQRLGNAGESALATYTVTGETGWKDPPEEGDLKDPFLVRGGNIINQSQIIGGLWVKVRPYEGMAIGDRVTLTLYLNAYYYETRAQHTATPHQTREVAAGELEKGMIFIFDQDDVSGFASSKSDLDPRGYCKMQYVVDYKNGGGTRYSKSRKVGLDDVQPDKQVEQLDGPVEQPDE